jgi:tetratricopeptide (TPR) repeat protein
MERNSETNPRDLFAQARGAVYETWQIGISRLPVWIFPPEGRPLRPRLVVYGSVDREEVGVVLSDDEEESESALVEKALRSAVSDWHTRPARIEVADSGLAAALADLLAGMDITVGLGSDFSLLRAAEREIVTKTSEPETSPPGLLSGDVTVARIAAFIQATGDFLTAAPWRLLGSRDLLHVEVPEDIDPELRWVSLVRAGKHLVVTFYSSAEEWDAIDHGDLVADEGTRWFLPMIPRWQLSANDADLWDRFDLPCHGEDALCPVPVCLSDDRVIRPDPHQLAFLEGLLRTLAASREQDVDTGRWEKDVATSLGPRHFTLSFPSLLELAEDLANPEEGLDPDDWIGNLLDEAQELGGRQAVLLARHVLTLRPDSAEACLELADADPEPTQALELYSRALDLANEDLDEVDFGFEDFKEDDDLDAGPDPMIPLRAHAGLAESLCRLGRREEAVAHLFEAYRLDPGDLMGHQDRLACLLVELGRDSEARALLDGNDGLGGPAYTLALIAFRREGDSPAARRALRTAYRNNSHIPSALLPNSLPEPEDDSFLNIEHLEAVDYAGVATAAWRGTPGALTWLAEHDEDLGLAARARSMWPGKQAKGQKKKIKKKKRR